MPALGDESPNRLGSARTSSFLARFAPDNKTSTFTEKEEGTNRNETHDENSEEEMENDDDDDDDDDDVDDDDGASVGGAADDNVIKTAVCVNLLSFVSRELCK